jgi:RNA polymerase sigma-70 factor (ECF subfamily)
LLKEQRRQFEQTFLPHMAAAYNLARWLMRDEHEAEDIVQEAYLRALKSFAGFHGTEGRAWLLTIVRNSCYSRLRRLRGRGVMAPFDEEIHGVAAAAPTPEAALVQQEEWQSVQQALEALPEEFREVIVLRELEGLSYKEIAAVVEISIGTVMSRLARGRALLERQVQKRFTNER